jgi:hypothetical protein
MLSRDKAEPFMVSVDELNSFKANLRTRKAICLIVTLNFIQKLAFHFNLFAVLGLLNAGVFLIIAFFKINGMPIHFFFLNLLQTLRKPRLRIWQKELVTQAPKAEKIEIKKEFYSLYL